MCLGLKCNQTIIYLTVTNSRSPRLQYICSKDTFVLKIQSYKQLGEGGNLSWLRKKKTWARKEWHMKKRSTSSLLSTPSALTGPATLKCQTLMRIAACVISHFTPVIIMNYGARGRKNSESVSLRLFSAITARLVKDQMEKASVLFRRKTWAALHHGQTGFKTHSYLVW